MEKMKECDFNDPASVVEAYIVSMNRWEIESWKAMRSVKESDDPSSYQDEVKRKEKEIFEYFCTKKERKYGRQGSFQKPPEYDPESEKILSTTIVEDRKAAIVETERDSVLGGGTYRYKLYRREGKWLIDNLKHEYEGKWEEKIL